MNQPQDKSAAIYGIRVAMYQRKPLQERSGNRPIQTVDIVAFAQSKGYDEKSLRVISPTTEEGFPALLEALKTGDIGTVFVSNESRLFKDTTESQVALFLRLCEEHHVAVCTPYITYDLSNPCMLMQFKLHTLEAAEYIAQMVQIRLQTGKRRAQQQRGKERAQ